MRALLKKNVAFLWLKIHEDKFEWTRALLCSTGVVKPFDILLPTLLLTDASWLFGFGFALVQTEFTGILRLIQCAEKLRSYRIGSLGYPLGSEQERSVRVNVK